MEKVESPWKTVLFINHKNHYILDSLYIFSYRVYFAQFCIFLVNTYKSAV